MTNEEAIHNLFVLKLRSRILSDKDALGMAIKALEQEPTAQWERYVNDYKKCSRCEAIVKSYHRYNYCPNCGAKMVESEG